MLRLILEFLFIIASYHGYSQDKQLQYENVMYSNDITGLHTIVIKHWNDVADTIDATTLIGATGSTGSIGSTGPIGATGNQGNQGITGAIGTTGSNGINGVVGIQGYTGMNGSNGSTGLTGANGVTGAIGVTGLIGVTGSIGATGASGVDVVLPYIAYTALVTQTGTNIPTASRKDSNFGGVTFTWARGGAGSYTLTASSAIFTTNKTVVIMSPEPQALQKYSATITSTSVITLSTNTQSVGLISLIATLLANGADGMLTNTLFEIRVYN